MAKIIQENERMKRNVKIYLASKLRHSAMAKSLILDHPYVTWTNRWQFFESEIPDTQEHAVNFWENDFDDVDAADVVLVYGVKGDDLRGALVEAGYGIGKGKRVVCCGDSLSFGTWRFSPRVEHFSGDIHTIIKFEVEKWMHNKKDSANG